MGLHDQKAAIFIEYAYMYLTPPISLVNTQINVAKNKTFQLNN